MPPKETNSTRDSDRLPPTQDDEAASVDHGQPPLASLPGTADASGSMASKNSAGLDSSAREQIQKKVRDLESISVPDSNPPKKKRKKGDKNEINDATQRTLTLSSKSLDQTHFDTH